LQFLTAHSSKGLSADNVIIINAKDELYGFPSKIEDDPVLNLVVSNDTSYNYAEERRLFYVALTRTKNRVYIVTPEKCPSEFIKELSREKKLYPKVTLLGDLKSDVAATNNVKDRCPICGYPMQFRWNKNYGLKLWICSNDQEVCGFMTNDQRGGNMSIHKCDWCQDGYLIVKKGEYSYILGCTNYKSDNFGCNRRMTAEYYQSWKNDNFGTDDISADKPAYIAREERDVVRPPKMIPQKESASVQPRKTASVNTIRYEERIIENDKFNLVVDARGNILTDIELLQNLISLRELIKKVHGVSISNQVLVALATDKPTTREEFMAIRGVGSSISKRWGDTFIIVIKQSV
ncbi:MAG: HRDC domain-containing protein, partial [Duncaniella sp.]|nr:HRDC domain-containing protein [Duncaniella sp.]